MSVVVAEYVKLLLAFCIKLRQHCFEKCFHAGTFKAGVNHFHQFLKPIFFHHSNGHHVFHCEIWNYLLIILGNDWKGRCELLGPELTSPQVACLWRRRGREGGRGRGKEEKRKKTQQRANSLPKVWEQFRLGDGLVTWRTHVFPQCQECDHYSGSPVSL